MSRLIDEETLCLSLGEYYNHIRNINGRSMEQVDAIAQDIFAIIAKVPTVDAEPVRRGYWVTTWNRYDKDGYVIQTRGRCSCCNQYSDVLDYCGNCGAKMDEVDE